MLKPPKRAESGCGRNNAESRTCHTPGSWTVHGPVHWHRRPEPDEFSAMIAKVHVVFSGGRSTHAGTRITVGPLTLAPSVVADFTVTSGLVENRVARTAPPPAAAPTGGRRLVATSSARPEECTSGHGSISSLHGQQLSANFPQIRGAGPEWQPGSAFSGDSSC